MGLSVKTIRKSLKLFGASDLQHSHHLLDHLQMLNYHKINMKGRFQVEILLSQLKTINVFFVNQTLFSSPLSHMYSKG